MGHLTLKMISIVAAALMIFSMARAENRADKHHDTQESSEEETPPDSGGAL